MLDDLIHRIHEKYALVRNALHDKESRTYTGLIDTLGNVTFSLAVGSLLDYSSGLDWRGIVGSRASASALNTTTGGLYGGWRDYIFRITRTTEKSHWLRNRGADLLAFNTFQVPVYAVALSVGSLVQEGEFDYYKVLEGCKNLAVISPLIAPTMGMYMNRVRKWFGVSTPEQRAE
ncbi:L-alanine exporter AlaE [Candidatus Woesearchaeota archaeon]|nr:L-alanine exporter AlaE [Candidatus Woesearchaeota archaeon]